MPTASDSFHLRSEFGQRHKSKKNRPESGRSNQPNVADAYAYAYAKTDGSVLLSEGRAIFDASKAMMSNVPVGFPSRLR